MSDQLPNPEIPAFHPPFKYRLQKFSEKLNVDGPVKIVAIGSSSTAGEGGIAPSLPPGRGFAGARPFPSW
jgi:hypothetical protein